MAEEKFTAVMGDDLEKPVVLDTPVDEPIIDTSTDIPIDEIPAENPLSDTPVVPEYLTRLFQDEYKTEEEFVTAHKTLKQEKAELSAQKAQLEVEKVVFPSDWVKQALEFAKNNPNEKPETFFNIVTRDYAGMDDMEIIREGMRQFSEVKLSDSQINLLMKKRFATIEPVKPSKDQFDETEDYNAAIEKYDQELEANELIAISRMEEAAKSRAKLIENQNKYKFDNTKSEQLAQELEQQRLQGEAVVKQFESHLASKGEIKDEYSFLDIDQKTTIKLPITYKLEERNKKLMSDLFAGKKNQLEKYKDFDEFVKEMTILQDLPRYISIVSKEAYNKGFETAKKSRANINLNGNPPPNKKEEQKGSFSVQVM